MVAGELIDFGFEAATPSIIMVAGVGGGGSNAVNHMYELGIAQVTFMICNTDKQALSHSPVPIKVKLGEQVTEGLGAGNNPQRGREAAMESIDQITDIFNAEDTRMVFITAGMGGGTGTGAAPVIAKAARDMGILTVGIVTLPFVAEGKVRAQHAAEGLAELRKHVDALLVVNNENIQEIYGKLPITEAFHKADDILATAAKGIAEVITREGVINVDFADVSAVMRGSGIALMGSGRASGDDRAKKVADLSLSSPLLNHNNINGARNILLNISWGENEITMAEVYGIVKSIQEQAGSENDANIIWGAGPDPSLGEDIEVTIIATGFEIADNFGLKPPKGGRPFTPPTPPDPAVRPPLGQPHPSPLPQPGAFRRPQQPAPKQEQGFGGIATQNRVIEVQENKTYDNLDQIVNEPAFKRRKVKFIMDGALPGTKSASHTVIREESADQAKPVEGSLFD